MRRLLAATLSLAVWMAGAAAAQRAEPAPGWRVEGAGRADHVKVAPFLGRLDAVWLRAGAHAVRDGVRLADGTIEFDVAPMDEANFVAVVFRRQSFSQHENVYFRIHRSGDFMALQYAPRLGSSTWQLYPEFLRTVTWPRNQWTPVRLVARGSTLDVYVGDMAKPALTVPRLRHGSAEGEIALWARVNGRPDVWAAAISNLRVTPAAAAAAISPAKPPPPEFVRRWRVAGPFAAKPEPQPPVEGWRTLEAEESGLVNLSRVLPQQAGKTLTAFARATIVSDRARVVRLGVGYSDKVEVRLNGQPVYGAVNGFDSRHPGYTGFVDTRFEHAFLPLKAGRNEVELAVTDDQAFGWGFATRLESLEGLVLEP